MIRVLSAALCLALPGLAKADFSAWNDSTRVYINTTPSGAGLEADVEEFPLLVRLDSVLDFKKVKAGGADIRFADPDGTLLPHEIELFDPAARICLAWVRVPRVDAGSLTDHIVLYWNNPEAAAIKAAVFDTALGYVAVYHLGEEKPGIGSLAVYRDATANGNHGDDYVSVTRVRSAIGFGQSFDGADDRIQVPHKASLALAGPLSISAWVKADRLAEALDQANVIVRKGDEMPLSYQLGVMTGRAFAALDADPDDVAWSPGKLGTGAYCHVAAAWEGRALKLYVNGVLETEIATTLQAGRLSKDARPLYIGGRTVNLFDPTSRDLWDGELDEVRLSRVAWTPEHFKLSYANQRPGSTLLTFKRFPPPGSEPVDIASWPNSRKILLNTSADGAAVAGDVARFPLLVRLDTGLFAFSQAEGRGADIRFSDPDGTALPYAIERWDSAGGKAEVWVRVPVVEGGSRTDFIRMHWGMAGAADAQNPAAVFDTADGFAGVWHLDAGAAGRTGSAAYKDQTAGRHHGQDYVDAPPAEGIAGKGQAFDGEIDRVKIPSAPAFDFPASLTFSAWIKGASWDVDAPQVNPILRKGEDNPNAFQLAVQSGRIWLGINDNDDGESGDGGVCSPIPLQTGLWYHVAATWQPGRTRIYVNGVLEADSASDWETPVADTRALYLGGRDSESDVDLFHGMLDEVQASRVARNADWIKLSYESQRTGSRLLVHEGYEHKVPLPDTSYAGKDSLRTRAPHPTWAWDTTLASGQRLGKDGVFSLLNPGPDPLRVIIQPSASADTFGVAGVEAVIRILSPSGDGTRPIAEFSMDGFAAGGRSVYGLFPGDTEDARLEDKGLAAGPVNLYHAGAFVVGHDTLAPRLQLLGEGSGGGDSTWAQFVAHDNVRLVNLKCFPEGAEGVTSLMRQEQSGVAFRLAFKPQAGLVPLKLFLSVDDGRMQSAFPPPPARHHVLSRYLPDFRAPLALKAGLEWELFGLPVSPATGLTLGTLAKASGADVLSVALWDPRAGGEGAYRILAARDTLPAGAALWLAADKPFGSLPLGGSRTLSLGPSGAFALTLRKGWNLVANPSLEPMPWVVSKSDLPAYDQSVVKGLNAYAGKEQYLDADTLQPWKGYFVYSGVDTTLQLTGAPPGLSKRAAAASVASVRIALEPLRAPGGSPAATASLRLGAAAYAEDGLGREDEPMPGTPSRSIGVAAIRDGRGLRTDLLRFEPGRTMVWKLAWSGGNGRESLPSAAGFRLSGLGIPPGMSLWAASAFRPGAVPLQAGAELRMEGDAADTLVLWAAPAGSWREGDPIPGMRPLPALRAARLARGANGLELRVDLPAGAGVRATLHAADGRRLGFWENRRMAPGYHAIPLPGMRARTMGLILVTLEFSDAPGDSRRVFKTLLP